MKIKEIKSEHRNDFTAVMVCEHCEHQQLNRAGYHDSYYHTQVIPAMTCDKCGKNRAGDVTGINVSTQSVLSSSASA